MCEELDKFQTPSFIKQVEVSAEILEKGLPGLLEMNIEEEKANIKTTRALPKNTVDEKETRKALIEIARQKVYACKEIAKNFSDGENFTRPDYTLLQKNYDKEDAIEKRLNFFTGELRKAKKKIAIKNKYVNEVRKGRINSDLNNEKYLSEIIKTIGN